MKNNDLIRIGVAEASVIIRSGVAYALKRLPNLKISPIELASPDALNDCLRTQAPHILFVNPTFGDFFDVSRFKSDALGKGVRVVALVSSFIDTTLLNKYDDSVSIFDDLGVISEKISRLQHIESGDENPEVVSLREKEIIICVVKGMTNKEIADKLYLSIHTVITHRRNISRKLQIHSAAGLTIYAIVNKLVALSDIKEL
ncbi:MAG: helix-turn-helix transcriptional regulator [Mediterranea sp.]|jgi:DNA-binding CsgD family transcriptional regulator|nr:helix-turn-helix transcriptional regulator [Mediterranea sp.]